MSLIDQLSLSQSALDRVADAYKEVPERSFRLLHAWDDLPADIRDIVFEAAKGKIRRVRVDSATPFRFAVTVVNSPIRLKD